MFRFHPPEEPVLVEFEGMEITVPATSDGKGALTLWVYGQALVNYDAVVSYEIEEVEYEGDAPDEMDRDVVLKLLGPKHPGLCAALIQQARKEDIVLLDNWVERGMA